MSYVIVTSLSNLQNEVSYGDNHTLITDEPARDRWRRCGSGSLYAATGGAGQLHLIDRAVVRQKKRLATRTRYRALEATTNSRV